MHVEGKSGRYRYLSPQSRDLQRQQQQQMFPLHAKNVNKRPRLSYFLSVCLSMLMKSRAYYDG